MKGKFAYQPCKVGVTIVSLIALLLGFQVGCGEKAREPVASVGEETARLISEVTSGFLSASDPIVVRFVEPQVSEDVVGHPLKKSYFSFSPDINGQTKWRDTRTMVFVPDRRLKFRTRYRGELDLQSLFPRMKDLEPLEIVFEVAGRELVTLSGDFQLERRNDPDRLRYTGTLVFSEPLELDLVRKSVSLRQSGRSLLLEWEEEVKGKSFRFVSEIIRRSGTTLPFQFVVENKDTEISRRIEKRFSLEPLEEFKLKEITVIDHGKRPGIGLRFSDELDRHQDREGLVRIEPRVETEISVSKKNLFVSGDFIYGKTYRLTVSNVRSRWGVEMKPVRDREVDFQDRKPQIAFLSDGVFLPTVNDQALGFRTMNLRRVHLEIDRVFESNLGQFLQSEQLKSAKNRNRAFNSSTVRRVGVRVVTQTLDIGMEKNRWLNHRLNLQNLLEDQSGELFLVTLRFEKKDMLYGGLEENRRYYYGRDYYSNPNSPGYIWRHGKVYKPVIQTDIGLTYKRGSSDHVVLATHIEKAEPLADVSVSLRTYQNQVIATRRTSRNGVAVFSGIKEKVYYVEGEKDGRRSVVKPDEMAWNLSAFDVGGKDVAPDETRTFIYTDRGVYRPGDTVHLALIARNRDQTFPENHPVTLKLYNPKNQLSFEHTSRDGTDGFYGFEIPTREDDLTGNYRVMVMVGGKRFFHPLKIETVAPYRLKVNIKTRPEELGPGDKTLSIDLSSTYLFGNPAAGLRAEVAVAVGKRQLNFTRFPGFMFDNENVRFKGFNKDIFTGTLDDNGRTRIVWQLPPLHQTPSALNARITAKVFERGGRFSRNDRFLPVHPFACYVGLEKPRFRYGYSRVGDSFSTRVIAVDREGRALNGRLLTYKIFRNSRYWWWEYDSREDFRLRFKKDSYTNLVDEGRIVSQQVPVDITFRPEQIGEYLIEVSDDTAAGHTAGFFFSAYYWGDSPVGDDSAGALVLQSDRENYRPGDTAMVTFDVPEKGLVYVSVEKANRILRSWTQETEPDSGKMSVPIEITGDMLPNVYVSISVIQPHEQTGNDRPLRMYGVIPLNVFNPDTRQQLTLNMQDELKSNEPFSIDIRTADKTRTQVTVAVVDEGLLDLTGFPSPDAWAGFFSKQRLGVRTFDLFAQVIGANKGDVFRLFSIGGDMDRKTGSALSRRDPAEKKRFEAVAFFKGPLNTDENGHLRVDFQMPNYIGAVRVMVVSAKGNRYGKAEKRVPVKTDLMLLPTLPRVLGPDDQIVIPVTVFALNPKINDVKVTMKTRGPLSPIGGTSQTIRFDQPGDREIGFAVKAAPAVGKAEIVLEAKAGSFRAARTTNLEIRAYSPRMYGSEKVELEPGSSIKLKIPDRGIPGTNHATVAVMRFGNLDLNHRLLWLIRYPYGCIEQTVSAVFPQLYLKQVIRHNRRDEEEIDANINEAIQRLRRFLLSSGAFMYWPGNRSVSLWGTNYAGHFLVEAKKLGYHVPDSMLQAWTDYQRSRARLTRDAMMQRVYRLYGLALAGRVEIGALNLIRENNIPEMSNTERCLLAAAYHLAGRAETARTLYRETSVQVQEYSELGGTYGSTLRDKAIILEVATLFEDWNRADPLYEEIADSLAGRTWYSTQTLGYALLAVGKYIEANRGSDRVEEAVLAGTIRLPGKKKQVFETREPLFSLQVDTGFGQDVEITIHPRTNRKRVFAVVEWDGVPLKPDVSAEEKNLSLAVEWLDEDGRRIDPRAIKQGTSFWGHFRVESKSSTVSRLEEMSLVQILPSGWEVENVRLLKEDMPGWMEKWRLYGEEYLDIRDDRVMWFFDLPASGKPLDFAVKLNAVTVGDFILPPTLFEAMYNHRYRAIKPGGEVRVLRR